MTDELTLSRRNLFALGGAITAGLLARPDSLHAAPDTAIAHMERELGSVTIRDLSIATINIEGEYPCNLIKVTTDSGLYGLGEARPKTDVSKLAGRYKGLIIGEDPLRVDFLARKMTAANERPMKSDLGVIAGIETALWDLAGKILKTPAYTLLGGRCLEGVPVYYDLSPSDTPRTTDPKPWVEWARHAKESGYQSMKLDVNRNGGNVPQWVKILEEIRADVGPEMRLGVDFHWKLSPEQAFQFVEMAEPVDLWFVEDPMRYAKNTDHYQRLVSEGKIPILAGEQMLTRKSFHDLIEKRMCTMIEADGQYCGGLLSLKRIAELGELYGMKTLCHNMCTPVGTYAQAHACVTIPSCIALESPIGEQVIQHDGPMVEDGYLVLNDKPGFGIELNEDYCRKHLCSRSTFFDAKET
jgi:L-alanine-DL-glutamate epimerase-like enolase superfamily enzyme